MGDGQNAFKVADHAPVERKSALLQMRVEPQPERTVKVVNSNKVLVYDRKKQEALSFNVETEALEIAQKAPEGALYRLTLGEPKFALQINEQALTRDSKAQSLFRGKFVQFVTKPTGDLVARGQSTLNSSTPANVRAEFDGKVNLLANAYEMTCIPLPNAVAAQGVLDGHGAHQDAYLVYSSRQKRDVRHAPRLVPWKVLASERRDKIKRSSACAELSRTARRAWPSSTARYPARLFSASTRATLPRQACLKVDCDVEFGDQALASYIVDVDLTRVPGNSANIVPSTEKPPPVVVKGKSILQVPLSSLGPGDRNDYPGKLAIPYKFWTMPFVGGKTYIIEMNKTGNDTIDPYLILHNPMNVKVAEDDDSGGELNARIVYQAPASGFYRIYATTLMLNQGGNFQLFISEAAPEPKVTDPKVPNPKKAAPPKGQKARLEDKESTVPIASGREAKYTDAVQYVDMATLDYGWYARKTRRTWQVQAERL